MGRKHCLALLVTFASSLCWQGVSMAERTADIANTKHNFSADPVYSDILPTGQTRVIRAQTEQQICVFCHTPHAAEPTQGPLWNRQLSTAVYETYNTSSLDATPQGVPLDQPNGVSKLCLSCHDGTMAIGAVNVLNGTFTDRDGQTEDIAMVRSQQSPSGRMPTGEGATTGFTRYLGSNLTNDHPISVTFDADLAARDGEMRFPNAEEHIIVRGVDPVRPQVDDIPLEPDPNTITGGLVQCNSCHDPHIRDTTDENIKFLRLNRLQKVDPSGGAFSKPNDIICLACHNKAGWAGSAHANSQVANEVYTDAAARVREFPNSQSRGGKTTTEVWESACLACHDTHTVEGSRRLLREGTDGATRSSSSGYVIKVGDGQPAIEETCYACHSAQLEVPANLRTLQFQGTAGFEVPNVKDDFTLPGNRHMPIATQDQPANFEVHDIGTINIVDPAEEPNTRGKDFLESPQLMGGGIQGGDLSTRHAECTDCHNIHRVIKNRRFNDDPMVPDAGGTHDHTAPHTNIASGVLKGIWGVEPNYGGQTQFGSLPISFDIKRGDPGVGAPAGATGQDFTYLTREYQVCLKCHSNYAYGNTPPMLGSFIGGTPSGTNSMIQYTNQAMEYNSPNSHQGEGTAPNSGAAAAFSTNNHRSWHPVMNNTGRTAAVRNANANNWLAPFVAGVGTQTMYCTDCHGNDTANFTVIPNGGENGEPWGPHGSINNFILKGPWSGNGPTNNDDGTGIPGTGPGQQNHLCFKCHRYNQYANGAPPAVQRSGFQLSGGCMGMCMGGGMMGGAFNNLHTFHNQAVTNFRCNLCHVAVPHGWKNKVFLVNLNDVKVDESNPGLGSTEMRTATTNPPVGGVVPPYFQGPYYNRAALKVVNFALSGFWVPNNCGSSGQNGGNGVVGVPWMAGMGMGGGGMGMGGGGGGNEACMNLP